MGLVYAPNQPIGKGATSGNIRNFNPRLAGGFSRIGTIITGVQTGYRFVRTNYKFFTGLGSVATGTGVDHLVGQTNNPVGETHQPAFAKFSKHRNFGYNQYGKDRRKSRFRPSNRCCCRNNSKGSLRRTMVSGFKRSTRYNRTYY